MKSQCQSHRVKYCNYPPEECFFASMLVCVQPGSYSFSHYPVISLIAAWTDWRAHHDSKSERNGDRCIEHGHAAWKIKWENMIPNPTESILIQLWFLQLMVVFFKIHLLCFFLFFFAVSMLPSQNIWQSRPFRFDIKHAQHTDPQQLWNIYQIAHTPMSHD